MAFELAPLPYDFDALEPHISARTMKVHHDKHHQGYVTKTNGLIEGTDLESRDIETVIRTARDKSDRPLFNNAAQVWNHDFFWTSMTPKNRTEPTPELAHAIDDAFGGMSGFRKIFKDVATGEFGSGWAWLVVGDDGLEVMSTSDADLPLVHGKVPLICCDVWEHAYYLDYQNERGKFVDGYLENLLNWEFAVENWEKRKS